MGTRVEAAGLPAKREAKVFRRCLLPGLPLLPSQASSELPQGASLPASGETLNKAHSHPVRPEQAAPQRAQLSTLSSRRYSRPTWGSMRSRLMVVYSVSPLFI